MLRFVYKSLKMLVFSALAWKLGDLDLVWKLLRWEWQRGRRVPSFQLVEDKSQRLKTGVFMGDTVWWYGLLMFTVSVSSCLPWVLFCVTAQRVGGWRKVLLDGHWMFQYVSCVCHCREAKMPRRHMNGRMKCQPNVSFLFISQYSFLKAVKTLAMCYWHFVTVCRHPKRKKIQRWKM